MDSLIEHETDESGISLSNDASIWVEWDRDGWWYPAIREQVTGTTIFFRWYNSGNWEPHDSADVTKVCPRINSESVPFALQSREAITAHSAFAITNAAAAAFFCKSRRRR
jgi:hypothetical protein